TEAFRSTYLDPEELKRRPDSIGKAIPDATIQVLRADGSPCAANENGELVHSGPLVAQGYWQDAERTAQRFRMLPDGDGDRPAVWSGDTVFHDEEGFYYFVGRRDGMIKTMGYRVSPSEIEEAVFDSGLVSDAVAIGVPHPDSGQAIIVVASPASAESDKDSLALFCRQALANYMVPAHIEWREQLPRTPNDKIDRNRLSQEFSAFFSGSG
ncbi:MAG: AMP-binding protein, partial [Gammaproteobacteria bacterium]|nr:AMP-binding protein [Gammaproteobacteria bacterium]